MYIPANLTPKGTRHTKFQGACTRCNLSYTLYLPYLTLGTLTYLTVGDSGFQYHSCTSISIQPIHACMHLLNLFC